MQARPTSNFFSVPRRVTDWPRPLASSSNLLFMTFLSFCLLGPLFCDCRKADAEFLQRATARYRLGQALSQLIEFVVHNFSFLWLVVVLFSALLKVDRLPALRCHRPIKSPLEIRLGDIGELVHARGAD